MDEINKIITGADIEALELRMLGETQVKCEVFHHFPEAGIYLREVRLPAGAFVVGHHQNFPHTNIFAKGRVTVLLSDGTTKELAAPMVFQGEPGRKVGYIHEDVVWYNLYKTEERDVEKLEATLLTKSDSFNRRPIDEQKLLAAMEARTDYQFLLEEKGFKQYDVDAVVLNEDDMIDMPAGTYKYQLGPSLIHGKGVFATADYAEGELVGVAKIGNKRTPLGRFTNHSNTPNARMVYPADGNIYLHTLRPIEGQRGGNVGEEICIDYREPLAQIHNL
jgi:SET domain